MDWTPKADILDDSANTAPTKPTEFGESAQSCTNPPEVHLQNLQNSAGSVHADDEDGASPADIKKAVELMNSAGIRIIRLPLGESALEYRMGTNLDEIRSAMRVLGTDSLPLVLSEENTTWMTWDEWRRRPEYWASLRREQQARARETGEEEEK